MDYDWFGADNWDSTDVPGNATDVVIPVGLHIIQPLIVLAVCDNILIKI